MGWDDNGLNVERRVQLVTGTIVDPTLPYDPDFQRPEKVDPKARPIPVSRPNFIELCEEVVPQFEAEYHDLWSNVGLSVDWEHTYTTIGPKATRTSQRGFLRLVRRRPGLPRRVAHALGRRHADRGRPGRAARTGSSPAPTTSWSSAIPTARRCPIDTTRPELLPACVAVVAHPDDERYQPLFGQTVTTPLFGAEVPIVAHRLADPEKGTGAAMVCTFGDTTDVTWWRELSLPIRADRPARRPAAPDHLGRGRLVVGRSRGRAGGLRRAGRQERQAGAEADRRAAHRGRRHRRRDPPDHPPGEVLGERHPSARDRHEPAVVHPLPGQGRDARPGQGAHVVARLHAGPLRGLGERPHRRLEHHPAALLRRAVPRVVPDRRGGGHRLPRADPRRRGVAAGRPHHRGADRATRSRSATSPAGSRPTPT